MSNQQARHDAERTRDFMSVINASPVQLELYRVWADIQRLTERIAVGADEFDNLSDLKRIQRRLAGIVRDYCSE